VVGISVIHSVGSPANSVAYWSGRYSTSCGAVPSQPTFSPFTVPLAITVASSSIRSIFLASMAIRFPEGIRLGMEKYSESTRSKLLGCVITRRATSSVFTAMYSISMPSSSEALAAIAGDWFTAVER
jgi:hypothetical protein